MLGISALAQLPLAGLPFAAPSAAVTSSPAWRRWLAQTYPEATLNRVPNDGLVQRIIAHMLTEGERLYQDRFKTPLSIDLKTGADGLVVTAEQDEELISVTVPLEALTTEPKKLILHPDIASVVELAEGYRITFKTPITDDSVLVKLPHEFPEDSDEDLVALLLATIH